MGINLNFRHIPPLYSIKQVVFLSNSSSKSSKAWLNRHLNDIYVKKSSQSNLRSRAIFKLDEIQQKYSIITPSSIIVDLGAAPGGWSLAASKIINPSVGGRIYAIDLLSFQPINNVTILQGDFLSKNIKIQLQTLLKPAGADVILSDMLQNTSGDKSRDHYQSMELINHILDFSQENLKKNGSILAKYLRGEDEKELIERIQTLFQSHKIIKPKASRQESNEIYVLCQGKI